MKPDHRGLRARLSRPRGHEQVRHLSATSVTVAANDGSSQTFTIDANTFVRTARDNSNTGQASLTPNQDLVVVSLNGNRTATAVVAVDPTSMGQRGPFSH